MNASPTVQSFKILFKPASSLPPHEKKEPPSFCPPPVKLFVKRGCEFHRLRRAGQLGTQQKAAERAWLREEQSRLETCAVTHPKAVTLQGRIIQHRAEWLVFVDDPRVPPTNNLAERALRPLVELRKLTFGQRSRSGGERMAKLMTVA